MEQKKIEAFREKLVQKKKEILEAYNKNKTYGKEAGRGGRAGHRGQGLELLHQGVPLQPLQLRARPPAARGRGARPPRGAIASASASSARTRWTASGWRRCRGPSDASPARRSRSRACCERCPAPTEHLLARRSPPRPQEHRRPAPGPSCFRRDARPASSRGVVAERGGRCARRAGAALPAPPRRAACACGPARGGAARRMRPVPERTDALRAPAPAWVPSRGPLRTALHELKYRRPPPRGRPPRRSRCSAARRCAAVRERRARCWCRYRCTRGRRARARLQSGRAAGARARAADAA